MVEQLNYLPHNFITTNIWMEMERRDLVYLNFISDLYKVADPELAGEWKKQYAGDSENISNEVWTKELGKIYYNKTVHTVSLMYVPNPGLAIKEHGHTLMVHDGRNEKKTRELYIYLDTVSGKVTFEFCGKDDKHQLYNNADNPIYVISVKVTGRR